MKRSTRISIIIAMALCIVLAVSLLVFTYMLPELVRAYTDDGSPALTGTVSDDYQRAIIVVLMYIIVVVALEALVWLFMVLMNILKQQVFSVSTQRYLLAVALSCFAEGMLFLPLCMWFTFPLVLLGLFLFIGLCLLVVRSVFIEAARIKQENELTV